MAGGRVQYDGWTTEVLATNLTIYRQGNVRMLVANFATISNPIVALSNSDKPSAMLNNIALRDDGNGNRSTCLFRVTTAGNVGFYTLSGSAYSAGSGIGILIWTV